MRNFHKITETQAEAIAELEKMIFSDPWTKQGIAETLEQPQAFIVAAEEENCIVGYCIFYYVLDEGEIARIAVHPDWRRKGVGKGILDDLSLCCKEIGVTRILLDVRESNTGARVFYRAYGFVEDGVRRNFYEEPKENAVLMSKVLS